GRRRARQLELARPGGDDPRDAGAGARGRPGVEFLRRERPGRVEGAVVGLCEVRGALQSFNACFSARTAPRGASPRSPPAALPERGRLLYGSAKRRNPMMRRYSHWAGLRHPLWSLCVGILGYALSASAAAAESPLELVRSTTNQALHVLTAAGGGT